MGSPYVGEIRMFAGSFAPAGWAMCDGRPLAISQNETLFNLIGTTYGGDGQSTFDLPNLNGRAPVHQGQGPSISQNYQIGESGGVEQVTLTTQQIPVHNHAVIASGDAALATNPSSNILAGSVATKLYTQDNATVAMNAQSLSVVGGSQPHENMQPFLVITFIIALFGIFPTQN